MKFVHVDSTFGYAATRSRAIKFHITSLRGLTSIRSKSTQVTEMNDTCNENQHKRRQRLQTTH